MNRLSRILFVLFILFSLITPSWRYGPFSWWPIWYRNQFSGGPVEIGLLNLLPILIILAWALEKRSAASFHRGATAVSAPLLLFTVLALYRLLGAPERFLFVFGGGLLLTWFVYLFVVNHPPLLDAALAGVILVQAAAGIMQFLLQGDLGLTLLGELPLNPAFSGVSVIRAREIPWLRAYGLTAHPNLLGALLALSMVLLITSYRAEGRNEMTSVTGRSLVVLIGMLALFFSFSRAAWLGMSIGLGFWLLVRWRHGSRPSRKTLISLLVIALAVVIALALYGDLARNRFTNLQDPLEARSISQRLSDARLALHLSLQEPWTGVGFGRYLDVAVGLSAEAQRVHNVLLLASAELGLPGLMLVLWLLLGPAWALIRRYRRGSRLLAASGLAPWLVVIVVNQLDTTLWLGGNWQTAILFALAAGRVSRTLTRADDSEPRPAVSRTTVRSAR